jgi:hypothetical protein
MIIKLPLCHATPQQFYEIRKPLASVALRTQPILLDATLIARQNNSCAGVVQWQNGSFPSCI